MKTTSLELSQVLKDAGAQQESERFYARRGSTWKLYSNATGPARQVGYDGIEEIVASFDCHELLEGFPDQIGGMKHFEGNWYQLTIVAISDGRYEVGYKPYLGGAWWHWTCGPITEHLGKLKLWCLENGHCDE